MNKLKKALISACVLVLALNLFTLAAHASNSSSGTINASDVNLRSGAGKSYGVIWSLQKGSKLEILAQDGNWYKVSIVDGSIGWVYGDFVSLSDGARRDIRGFGSRSDSESPRSITEYAKTFQGVRYVWGGSSPKGFDCSGFTSYVYRKFGIELNRVAADQARQGTHVDKSDLKPGDLVFFDTDGGHNYINHTGIYLGDSKFIHATSGAGKVMISSLNDSFYAKTYMTARSFR